MKLPVQFDVKKAAIVAWIVFSIAYIGYTSYDNFRNNLLQGAYQAGKTDAVNAFLEQGKTCQPFNVFSGNSKADFIDVACLKQTAEASGSGARR